MEYGVMPKLDAYSDEQMYKAQTVQPLNATSEVIENKKSTKISTEEFSKLGESKNIKSEKKDVNTSDFVEFTLTNLNFGYNRNSKDFFVKVKRGDSEYQYPTEEMMKLKAFLLKTEHDQAIS